MMGDDAVPLSEESSRMTSGEKSTMVWLKLRLVALPACCDTPLPSSLLSMNWSPWLFPLAAHGKKILRLRSTCDTRIPRGEVFGMLLLCLLHGLYHSHEGYMPAKETEGTPARCGWPCLTAVQESASMQSRTLAVHEQ